MQDIKITFIVSGRGGFSFHLDPGLPSLDIGIRMAMLGIRIHVQCRPTILNTGYIQYVVEGEYTVCYVLKV